jgi:hypothetical protein
VASTANGRDQLIHPSYKKPELMATAPNPSWSWDITKLRGPAKWTYLDDTVLSASPTRASVIANADGRACLIPSANQRPRIRTDVDLHDPVTETGQIRLGLVRRVRRNQQPIAYFHFESLATLDGLAAIFTGE